MTCIRAPDPFFMALAHLVLGLPPLLCRSCQRGAADEGRGVWLGFRAGRVPHWLRSRRQGRGKRNRGMVRCGKARVDDAVVVEGKVGVGVEIPVSCYQIIGVTDQAEKDEIVKSVKELKGAEIEDGYSMDVILSRQDVLMDVRDKLLFEPEYAGNFKEKILPKSSLRIPWAWLPGALCLLQEVGEVKLVLEIGQAALQHPDAKPYTHDLLLSMALAELLFAKAAFEKRKVSQGFEALARAQYLLRSKASLEKLPLLSQIEESMEELAPACTLEILSLPSTPENDERRTGAISALREMIRQGLEVEPSCRVQDWPCFLRQALSKLAAAEIVDLLSWDNLVAVRKNKKSLEYQNQRAVIDYDCFYLAMIAHIALGFSRRQTDLITKAKAICECLAASEGADLTFEDGLCLLLLGQSAEKIKLEKLYQSDSYRSSNPASSGLPMSSKESTLSVDRSMEMFLKDVVLDVFPDTRGGSPSLVSFLGGRRKFGDGGNHIKANIKKNSRFVSRPSTFNAGLDRRSFEDGLNRHIGETVKQLAPLNLQSQSTINNVSGNADAPSFQLKRELGTHQRNSWEKWFSRDWVGKVVCVLLGGCFALAAAKLLCLQYLQIRTLHKLEYSHPKVKNSALGWAAVSSDHNSGGPAFIDKRNILDRIRQMVVILRKKVDISSKDYANLHGSVSLVHKRLMSLEDAEELVKQWQAVKAEALGPKHKAMTLYEVLDNPMLSQWQDLADSARSQSCFWRFVLLNVSIARAEIILDGVGKEMAEIEAVVEEAAELVNVSDSKNPNYYSTYKVTYLLKRQLDGTWRFYTGDVQSPD